MWAKTFEGHCSKGFALGSGLAWTTGTHGFEKFSVIGAVFSGHLIRYLWPSMATSANGIRTQDAKASPFLRVTSGMIWPKDLCGMLQGARMPLITSSPPPPEHCLGALPNLAPYPPRCPSAVGVGVGATEKSDAVTHRPLPPLAREYHSHDQG